MIGNLSMGNMSAMIGVAITLAVAGIVLLTVAPGIVGDIDQIFLNSRTTCELNGERFEHLSAPRTGTNTDDETWALTTSVTALNTSGNAGTACKLQTPLTTPGAGLTVTENYYTPNGTLVTVTYTQAAASPPPGSSGSLSDVGTATIVAPFASLTALGGGSLVTLLFGAMAILLPVGAIAFLGYMGGRLVQQNVGGGGGMAVAISAAVGTAVVAAILPSVFEPLDNFYQALDGVRYAVYSTGIGRLGQVLGDFLAVSLIAGIIVLGALLWKGQKGDGSMGSNGNKSMNGGF